MSESMLPGVVLKNGMHRNAHQVLMHFKYNDGVIARVRTLPNVRWSKTMKCWYVPHTPETVHAIRTSLNGVALLDYTALAAYQQLLPIIAKKEARVLNDTQRGILNAYYTYLKGKRYSESTVKTYTYLVADFVEFHGLKPLDTLTNRDVELFIENVLIRKQFSISTQRQFVSALKLFVVLYPETAIHNLELTRPKKSQLLPSILSQEEMIGLLRHATNLKHRAILALIYSSGLRISELIQLELKYIYADRKQVLIKNGKGRKDRYVVLADSIMPLLHNYVATYKPQRYFVESLQGGHYSASSVRKFLSKYCKRAGIRGIVTPHTLRHSYATHLLEQGVNLRYIQELLGHSKPETTMIYTHVARKDLIEIKSPLDTAVMKLGKTQNGEQKFHISGKLRG